jgi:aspartyl-tRNA(Asn)/glutamyl-tRNA(Gln) amidotransferase subunit C
MKISKEDVKKVAELARLEFNEAQTEKFTDQMGNILEYIEKLNELNTDNVAPTSHVLDISTPLREDKVQKLLTIDEVLQNAPESEDDFFVVPQVIED